MPEDQRLIEDYLPIVAISKEASREKSLRKGHISTLHLWWARRPLVACRAAVYGALVPAKRFVPNNGAENKRKSLGRANAAKFVTELCKYPGDPRTIAEAQEHILEAHAERLTKELEEAKVTGKPPAWVGEFKFAGEAVTTHDIVGGRAPRPRVLDMFAGGGAIPLEALRLGCEAYALDLNPVAHIIQLCTLVYPQKYGNPDPAACGMTGPRNGKGESTWGGLAAEVRYWGNWVLQRVRKEIGDLYPLIPDPEYKTGRDDAGTAKKTSGKQTEMYANNETGEDSTSSVKVPPGYLMPVAYLWTRTVRCKNPKCGATVPLVKQTWLCKKEDRYAALRMVAPRGGKQVRFEVVKGETEVGLGFDPAAFSKGGNATCPFCGTVADADYVQTEGKGKRIRVQLMAVVCQASGQQGKTYISADDLGGEFTGVDSRVAKRLADIVTSSGLTVPSESISSLRPSPNARGLSAVTRHGLTTFGELFVERQKVCLLAYAAAVCSCEVALSDAGVAKEHRHAISTYLGLLVNRIADYNSTICSWHNTGEKIGHTYSRQALSMVWDFCELAPLGGASGSPSGALDWIVGFVEAQTASGAPSSVQRGSATELPWPEQSVDAVVTDPPYYDNVPYADISDFFYVWMKRTIGAVYPAHFATELTPKKSEATALSSRYGGDMGKANADYESMMFRAFQEAYRVLKPEGSLVVVYAHKTTLGWATLIEALRRSGMMVVEAWPLDTEMKARLLAMESAALASSIFLVGRKRAPGSGVGNYENDVQPDLQQIVRERVDTLWSMGIAGADLVIACVGAGLRAFTKYEKVEYANGEEMPAEKFLAEVEGVVLDAMMGKLLSKAGGNVSAVDAPSRFYILWRFVYGAVPEIDAGEAIVFTYSQHVELDGPLGLSVGKDALVEKKKAKYRARDYSERGDNERLGLPNESQPGAPVPLIDALHRVLWLMENSPRKLNAFLDEARPDRERLRVLAQALAGAALSGKSEEEAAKLVSTTPAEQAALGKLLANWRTLVESRLAAEDGTLFGRK